MATMISKEEISTPHMTDLHTLKVGLTALVLVRAILFLLLLLQHECALSQPENHQI